MSIWLEIHCDVRKDGMDDPLTITCHTARGDNPGAMAKDISSARTVLVAIEREAMAAGWVRSRGKWGCPGCSRA